MKYGLTLGRLDEAYFALGQITDEEVYVILKKLNYTKKK